MAAVPFSQARSRLTDLVNEVLYAKKRVVLSRKGKAVAAIVSLEDLKILLDLQKKSRKKIIRKDRNRETAREASLEGSVE